MTRSPSIPLLAGALVLAWVLGARPLRGQTPTVTLDDAIRLARFAQPSVVQARSSVQSAEAQVRSAKGAYLPSVTASSSGGTSFSAGPSRINPVTNEVISGNSTNSSVNLGLSATLDLFTGFRRGADTRAAKATRSAAEASLTDQEFQSELLVTQQFLDALAAQQLVQVRETSVKLAEEQLNLSVAKLRVGSATRADSLQSLVNLGNAQLALATANSNVVATQAALGRTVGRDGRVAAADDSAFYTPATIVDTAEVTQEALNRSPSVLAADASAQAAAASVRSAQSQYWPTLALSGGTSWNGSSSSDYQLFNSRQLSLSLSWPLFNRFQREQTIVNRQVAQDNAEAVATDTRRAVQADVTTQLAALDAARLQIDITRTSLAAARENLRVVGERYRVGAATIVDVLTSQAALAQAGVDEVTARFAYLKAKAQIEALIGRRL
jgi:outer membrane protein